MRWFIAIGAGIFVIVLAVLFRRESPQTVSSAVPIEIVQSPQTAPPTRRVPLVNAPEAAREASSVPSPWTSSPTAAPVEDAPEWVRSDAELEPRDLYARLRREGRDAAWADRSESNIRTQLAKIPYLGGPENSAVRCGITICEVTGAAPEKMADAEVNLAWQAVQSNAFLDALRQQGLTNATGVFGRNKNKATFTLYYTRRGDAH